MLIHLNREKSIDILRGIAVLLMILAHAVAYFYEGHNPLLGFFRTFGDMTAFIIFVFVAGATTYFANLDFPRNEIHEIKFNRISKLLTTYYLVAFVSALENFAATPFYDWPQLFLKILIFVEVPDYTEFILTFVLFSVVLFGIQWKLKSIIKSKLKIFIISLIAYISGYLIYTLVDTYPLVYYTSLFAGHEDWYRFPLLQYLPVLFVGIYVGKLTDRDYQFKHKKVILLWLNFIFLLFTALCFIFPSISAFPFSNIFNRWPPSLGFISVGMSTSLVLITILTFWNKLPGIFENILMLLGQHALGFFTTHIILYEIIDLAFPELTTQNSLLLLAGTMVSFVICYLVIRIWDWASHLPHE